MHNLAIPTYLKGFLCTGLPCVAPYCVPGGIRAVSENGGLGAAAFADQIRRVRLRRSMSLVSSALPGAAPALRPGTTGFPQAATLSGHSRLSQAVRETGSSTKNTPASIGRLTCTSALGYRSAAIDTQGSTDTLRLDRHIEIGSTFWDRNSYHRRLLPSLTHLLFSSGGYLSRLRTPLKTEPTLSSLNGVLRSPFP